MSAFRNSKERREWNERMRQQDEREGHTPDCKGWRAFQRRQGLPVRCTCPQKRGEG